MRWLSSVLLLACAASSMAAMCITHIEQRGDAGPWIGEIVNRNQYRASDFEREPGDTAPLVRDALGADAGPVTIAICPAELEPGEMAAFEMRLARAPSPGLTMPLSATAPIIHGYSGFNFEEPRDALHVELLSSDTVAAAARVVLRNESEHSAYPNGRACGVARDAGGAIVSVSDAVDIPNLDPGESTIETLPFSSLAGATTIDVHARASEVTILEQRPGGARVFDLTQFQATLPAGWHYYPQQGIDSFVGKFGSDDGAEIYFDFGGYTGGPDHLTDPAYRVIEETIDGHDATIVVPQVNRTGDVALYIGGIGRRNQFPGGQAALAMYGHDFTAQQQRDALAIFRSIDFPPE
jgi:hypothetical protein